MDGLMDGWVGGWVDSRWMDGQMGGGQGRRVRRQVNGDIVFAQCALLVCLV